jgi:hypothetical protein
MEVNGQAGKGDRRRPGNEQAYREGWERAFRRRPQMNRWRYTTTHNGTFVTIHAPDGRTAFLQGEDAEVFMRKAGETTDVYTDADLCREYESLVTTGTDKLRSDSDQPRVPSP